MYLRMCVCVCVCVCILTAYTPQYMRGMVRLAGDLGLTEDDMNLLYSKYERNGAFNYYAFCKDMDNPPTHGSASEMGSPARTNFQTPLQVFGHVHSRYVAIFGACIFPRYLYIPYIACVYIYIYIYIYVRYIRRLRCIYLRGGCIQYRYIYLNIYLKRRM
jgi:hypothetical protein